MLDLICQTIAISEGLVEPHIDYDRKVIARVNKILRLQRSHFRYTHRCLLESGYFEHLLDTQLLDADIETFILYQFSHAIEKHAILECRRSRISQIQLINSFGDSIIYIR